MNKPVGGIAGQAAREEQFAEMGQQQETTPIQAGSKFEYLARGGVGNTVTRYSQDALKKVRFQQQIKLFEQLMAGQQKAAQALYEDAVKVNGDEIKNWIPLPELFIDDSTGAFMPMKYAEAVATGIREYKKNAREESRQDLAVQREGRMESIARGGLEQKERQISQTGAYQRGQLAIGAERNRIEKIRAEQGSKGVQTEELKLLKQYEDLVFKDQESINKINDDIRSAFAMGDEKGMKDAEKLRKTKVEHLLNATKTLKKIRANMSSKPMDDKAITVATDIENSVSGMLPADEFEAKYGFSTERVDEKTGERVQIEPDADPVALRVYMYAQMNGINADIGGITEALKSTTLEDIIARINKQKKSVGIAQ